MKNIIDFYNENGYYIFKDVFTTNGHPVFSLSFEINA